jgi:hypothetical protein
MNSRYGAPKIIPMGWRPSAARPTRLAIGSVAPDPTAPDLLAPDLCFLGAAALVMAHHSL